MSSFFDESTSTPHVSTRSSRDFVDPHSNEDLISSVNTSASSSSLEPSSEKSVRSNMMSSFSDSEYVPINALDLDDPNHNKAVVAFLLDKVDDLEKRIENVTDENARMQERIEILESRPPVDAANDSAAESDNETVDVSIFDNLLAKHSKDITELTEEFKETQTLCAANMLKILKNNRAIEALDDSFTKDMNKVYVELSNLHRNVTRVGQYTRRNNLIIDGIPNSVRQERLESVCVRIVNELGFQIKSAFEVEGCHRLGFDRNGFTPVIIRFTNRKVKEFCLSNQGKLKHINCPWKISMREDLEVENGKVEQICSHLKETNHITNYIIRNGFIKIFREGIAKPSKIGHLDDLRNLFPDYFDVYFDEYLDYMV